MESRKTRKQWIGLVFVFAVAVLLSSQNIIFAMAASDTKQGSVSLEQEKVSGKEGLQEEEITRDTVEKLYQMWKENGMSNLEVDMDEISNCKMSSDGKEASSVYETEADVPIFMVLITDGENGVVTSAFYVRDTYGSGGTYLVTSALAKIFLEEGYEVIVAGPNYPDYMEKITTIHAFEDNSLLAFMEAEGVREYAPLEMADEIDYENCYLGFLEIVEEEFNLDTDWFDLSEWTVNGPLFLSDEEESGYELLGAPAYTGEYEAEVFGMFFKDENNCLVIVNMMGMNFPEEAMIEQTEVRQEESPVSEQPVDSEPEVDESETNEPSNQEENGSKEQEETNGEQKQTGQQPAQNENRAKEDNSVTIIVAIATFLILSFFISKNQKKGSGSSKKKPPVKAESDYREGTIEMKEEMQIPPTVNIEAKDEAYMGMNPPIPEWQLRGLGGTFEGQTYLLEHQLSIGRNPAGQIVYPQNTKGISGSHCEIRLEQGNVILIDLQSTYGTYFANGMKVEPRIPYQLKEGDCFYLAEKQQMFRLERAGEYRQKLTPAVKRIAMKSGPHPKAEGVYGSWQEEKIYRAGLDGKMYFGKSPNCQVVFDEPDSVVSTIHCVLYREDSNLYLMDLGSVNGTFFEDGNRLRPDVPYLVKKGSSFYLVSKSAYYTFVITED